MKDLIHIPDFTPDEIRNIMRLSHTIKKNPFQTALKNHTMAMIFEKPSLRTRATFEIGMVQLGGYSIYLQPGDIKLGQRETVADVARNLDRWVDIIMARTFSHDTIVELAHWSKVPVINALSDWEHPCQALADFFTAIEHGKDMKNFKMAFIGDGNNVCHSLMLLSAQFGADFALACPPGYEPEKKIIEQTQTLMSKNGGTLTVTHHPDEAVENADAVYTDVWVSMGQENESIDRKKLFQPYKINTQLLKNAKPDALVMHCLPAHRGEEITNEVIESKQSVVFDQAENRLHVQKAIILTLLHKDTQIHVSK